MAEFTFKCSQCDETHVGIPALSFEFPAEYASIPEEERDARTELSSDQCIIDGKWFFILALLDIPVQGLSDILEYGLWVSVSEESFDRYMDLYDMPGRESEPPMFAWVTSPPQPFPEAVLKAYAHFSPLPSRPQLELEPTDHPLAIAQREGISQETLKNIIELALHGE